MATSDLVLPFRVQSHQRDVDNESREVLDKINQHTLEEVQSLDQVFTFSGICSNDRLDSYLTKMDPTSTLNNYQNDLRSGIPLMPGHDISKAPYGRSYDGVVLDPQYEGDPTSVRSHWYILRDLNINGDSTNDIIRTIKGGIQKEMSVGFGGNEMWYRCSSCGRNFMDWDCTHFPGLDDENGRQTFAWVMDAHLREVSTVYRGATPGAYIDKARQFVDQGQLSEKHIMKLEREYHTRLDDGRRSFSMPKKEVSNKEGQVVSKELLDNLRSEIRENKMEKGKVYDILTEEGEPFRQPDDIALRNELGREYTNVSAVRQLKKEAQQGRRYLSDMIDDAVSARVRAQGSTFNTESYRQMLRDSGQIDVIKEEIDAYERLLKNRFEGGRETEPTPIPDDKSDDKEDKGEPENTERKDDSVTQFRIDAEDNFFGSNQ